MLFFKLNNGTKLFSFRKVSMVLVIYIKGKVSEWYEAKKFQSLGKNF